MAGGIVMLEGHVRMSLQERYHMREEDVFLVTHSVEMAYYDRPSISKSISHRVLYSGATLIPLTINANPTITPSETQPRLVSD
jgi:hypothetical protein